jgi:hypothetical protein
VSFWTRKLVRFRSYSSKRDDSWIEVNLKGYWLLVHIFKTPFGHNHDIRARVCYTIYKPLSQFPVSLLRFATKGRELNMYVKIALALVICVGKCLFIITHVNGSLFSKAVIYTWNKQQTLPVWHEICKSREKRECAHRY